MRAIGDVKSVNRIRERERKGFRVSPLFVSRQVQQRRRVEGCNIGKVVDGVEGRLRVRSGESSIVCTYCNQVKDKRYALTEPRDSQA